MTPEELAKLAETRSVTRHWVGALKNLAAVLSEEASYEATLSWVNELDDLRWKVRKALMMEQAASTAWHGGAEPEPVRTEDGLSLEDLGL